MINETVDMLIFITNKKIGSILSIVIILISYLHIDTCLGICTLQIIDNKFLWPKKIHFKMFKKKGNG